jgi:hypothetical protein
MAIVECRPTGIFSLVSDHKWKRTLTTMKVFYRRCEVPLNVMTKTWSELSLLPQKEPSL